MKLMRCGSPGEEQPAMLHSDGTIRNLAGIIADIDGTTLASEMPRLTALDPKSLPVINAPERYAEPVARVGKFICVGLNYRDHAAESNMPIPAEPILFLKATSAICGPNDEVLLPPASTKSDWEVELGVVIGKEARYVSEEDALAHVAGLCVINDLSEREYQLERGGQWDKGKGCDTFGPFGPYLVTLDEIEDIGKLHLWLDVNGERKQDGTTANLIFSVPYLVHYISQFMSLQPGDVISTGTPAGVGLGFDPPRYLAEGDIITLGVEGLGEQRQVVRRYKA